MTTSGETQAEGLLCSVVSKANGEDPTGSAAPFDSCLMVEVGTPWEGDVTLSSRFPDGLREIVADARGQGLLDKFAAIMPDPEYSREGHTRFLRFRRPPGPFARYEKDDFLVPDDDLVPVLEALFAGPDELAPFARYKQETSHLREIMVCTHGGRDACCGKFGFPFYCALRQGYAYPGTLRVWRSSHIGGHRFAPTLLDLPEGRYWGHLEPEAAENLVLRDGAASNLTRFYRGWAGLGTKFEQIAEREILAREGWGWTEHPKKGRVLREDGGRVEVRIEYAAPDGALLGAYEATIEPDRSVRTLESSGTDPLIEVELYAVSRLEKIL